MSKKLTVDDMAKLEEEILEWQHSLNNIAGPIAFAIAVGILSLPFFFIGLIASMLSFWMIFLMCGSFINLKGTRKKIISRAKSDPYSKEAIEYFENSNYKEKYYLPYSIGMLSLWAVTVWHVLALILYVSLPEIGQWFPNADVIHAWISNYVWETPQP